MALSLTGKTAIITGASKGIGKATALALARAGANVVINYSSDDASANELVTTITSDSQSHPPKALAVKADAGDVQQLETLVKKVVDMYGKIDILIANAGIMPMKDLEHTTEELFDNVMRVNVKGPFFLAQVSQNLLLSILLRMLSDPTIRSCDISPVIYDYPLKMPQG